MTNITPAQLIASMTAEAIQNIIDANADILTVAKYIIAYVNEPTFHYNEIKEGIDTITRPEQRIVYSIHPKTGKITKIEFQ